MPTICVSRVTSLGGLVAGLACLVACSGPSEPPSATRPPASAANAASPSTPARQDDLTPLATTVRAFIQRWLVDRATEDAVRSHLETAAYDERLIPAEFFDADDYKLLSENPDKPRPIDVNEASRRFATLIPKWRQPDAPGVVSLDASLAGIGPDDVPELWQGLKELDVSPQILPGISALTYRLRGPDSYDWIASDTVGFSTVIPQMIAKGRQVNGVVCRIRERGTPKPWMLFMFWSKEGAAGSTDWKLVSLTPVPTE